MRRVLLRVSGPVLVWGMFALLLIPYAALRGIGDEFFPPRGIEGIEGSLGGFVPTRWLQERTYIDGIHALDFPGFLLHLSWFFLPFGWSIVIAVRERHKMLEFYAWVLAASYLSALVFLVLPVRPPWMEPGIHRVLEERAFMTYTNVDDNQFAAFPSLHAAIPMTIALFYWLRASRGKGLAVAIAVHGLLISFAVVYLGEHWFADVFAGWLLAASVAWLFTSRRARAVLNAAPGRPLRHIGRLNQFLMDAGAGTDLAAADPQAPEVLQEAA